MTLQEPHDSDLLPNQPKLSSRSTFRLAASLVTAIAVIVILNLTFALHLQTSMIDMRKQEIKRLVVLSLNVVEPILKRLEAGEIERDEAIRQVRKILRSLVYDDPATKNYIFMSTYDGIFLVQPFEPEMEGTNQWNMQDVNGKYTIRELVKTARQGEGYVEYYYPTPDRRIPEKKISYVVGVDSLNSYIGTGLYINDINIILFRHFRSGALGIIGVLLGFTAILVLLFRPYYKAYNFLLHQFSRIAENPDKIETSIPSHIRDHSEVRILLYNFRSMLIHLRNSRDQIETSLKEKEVLLKEVHHRVKNNLQIISSLLNLQSSELQPGQQHILQDSVVRIRAMALVHESIYAGETLHSIDMAEYVRQLSASILQLYISDSIHPKIEIRMEGLYLSLDQAVVCGLILTELLTNALKHAFDDPRNGKISVTALTEDTQVLLSVGDNGKGMDPSLLENPNGSLGLTLIQALTQQIEGSLSLETGNGTVFTVSFPRSEIAGRKNPEDGQSPPSVV
ncbi:cache domain-containing protein [Marispirochaeta aestuarii]|uniref:cache domain-containing protein n=1 Tax=Marispirochaeta aestuarii TaxID=1963862 RepID=UPI0029C8A970|nr:cache domain-containing protein [Marispirochaeta aestuarii]